MGLLEKFKLDGKKVFVTGGSQGIGKAVALGLAEAGADIAIVARGLQKAEEAAHQIAKLGVKAVAVQADVTVPEQVDNMIKTILKAFGTVDVAFNNAGTAAVAKAEEMSYEDLTRIFNVNLTGLFLCAQAAARVMIKNKKGSIINMASMSAHVVNVPQQTANYNASKAGVVQLTKCLAVEWAPHNVRVNAIAPSWFESNIGDLIHREPGYAERAMRRVPVGRMGTPDELIGAVLYLASDASTMVTGHILAVDGGTLAS